MYLFVLMFLLVSFNIYYNRLVWLSFASSLSHVINMALFCTKTQTSFLWYASNPWMTYIELESPSLVQSAQRYLKRGFPEFASVYWLLCWYKFSTQENINLSQGNLSKQQLDFISDLTKCKNRNYVTVTRHKFYAYWKQLFSPCWERYSKM